MLKLCTKTNTLLSTYLFIMPPLFAYYFLQGSHLVKVIRVDFCNLIKLVVHQKSIALDNQKNCIIHFQTFLYENQYVALHLFVYYATLVCLFFFFKAAPSASNTG